MNVKIIAAAGTANDVRIVDEDGRAIEWVTGVTWTAQVNDLCRATIELSAIEAEVEGVAIFYVKGKEVRRIEYADGSVDEYEPAP